MNEINPLKRLWESTEDLYRRFDLDAPMVDRVIKFNEEAHEFLTEALKTTGENGALVVEGWDVIVTIIGILQKSGISMDQFFGYEEVVSNKNNAKTHETHVIHNGLITRRSKLDGSEG
jgi:phosphoribosyl-ATP pyrophosphohydrolase